MKKVLVDLNVLLDFLAKRENHERAAMVINLCETKVLRGYVAAHEITTMAYFLTSKYKSHKNPNSIISGILDIFSAISVNEKILRSALDSNISDYEDAVIEQCALKENIDYIITSNISDFKKGKVNSITPSEYLARLNN